MEAIANIALLVCVRQRSLECLEEHRWLEDDFRAVPNCREQRRHKGWTL